MKKQLIFLVTFLLTSIAWSNDSIRFHDKKLSIPGGFVRLSGEQLTLMKSAFSYRELLSAYEQKSGNGLQRLVLYYDSLTDTKMFSFQQIVEIKTDVIRETGKFSMIELNDEQYYGFGTLVIAGDTSLFGFLVDEFGIMDMQYDCSAGIESGDISTFRSILQSVKHRFPYEYEPENYVLSENNSAGKYKKDMEGTGFFMIIALIASGLVWVVRKYVLRK